MTLTFYKDNTEIMSQCVLWWQGRDQTTTGFPILPSGVTATPAGTWANDLSLGNNKTLKTFDGSGNYISLTDNDAWTFGSGDFTISCWFMLPTISARTYQAICGQYVDDSNRSILYYNNNSGGGICWFIGGGISLTQGTNSGWNSGVWYHVTMVKSGNTYTIYKNGTSAVSGTNAIAYPDLAGTFNIGMAHSDWVQRILGNIKDLIIYKGRALTQVEITTLMRMTNPNTGREFELLYPGQRGVE